MKVNELNEKFFNSIPNEVKECVNHTEDYYRIDVPWGFLHGVKKPGTNLFEFDLLFKGAEAIMTIPHSNHRFEQGLVMDHMHNTNILIYLRTIHIALTHTCKGVKNGNG